MKNDLVFIVFDLEATCEKDKSIDNEIVEIGALKLDKEGNLLGKFDKFIKPKNNPILTDFCKELTSITQEDIDNADCFTNVLNDFKKFVGVGENPYLLCSWGFYDRKQLVHDCNLHKLQSSWVINHISLKHQYQTIKNIKRAIGVQKALQMEGMKFEGTQHRGIDDAENISKIFIKYQNNWVFNTLTY